jgi:hypothetical protein
MLIRISSSYFTAGYDTESKTIVPIIKYIKGWSVEKIVSYCRKKNWKIEIVDGETYDNNS